MGHGDARQGPGLAPAACGIRGPRLGEGALRGHGDEAVEPGIEALDAGQEMAGQLLARGLAAVQGRRQLGERQVMHAGPEVLTNEIIKTSR